ncbi:allophanate hydrolase [Bradyrhizobium sp. U87765 SZCCT0131]|uniref:allophanate hydrolase n=1 Tax=unclassified Bradyrhizobium TaxID=2631580 RepID=UPI001BAA8614|nr:MULTISPECIES: allophanate hydrolase [unclassified Bradyrhizobium]MBR1221112.1 allophanate hydrolase [Bradyrhizobium sp. U87765 SZCCT0131]MBR1260068.1 allophanate hydrolase [Bradyrhizobium sp. U87765 SZCCT0134]MBR1307683.1 allophanate hydrolase [Bradyrhizobium sp. U87765 SZCCT0110]MBR1321637.1 allophanate hydrolase [Bradyrhizobium sp. U87765 SZCCT0109]MBR1349950.1 allophanate hydrolase [Bradyrhizobium sp. U87765 SZCCT0048]
MDSRVIETIDQIVAAHRSGTTTPADTVARTFARIRAHGDPAIFISLRAEADAIAEARALADKDPTSLPLYGVPVAVKDNIDVAGLPTTAACPAFASTPTRDATAVAKLRAAGAIVIGKTNLDQFATGLVGVRSPYGIPKNPVHGDLVPGGSSSGSAVAVAAGLVPLALGTDTAGSGRVPAMLNNIVGLKPSVGMISTAGVVPACRTLDCVSIFALTTDDAVTALSVMTGLDASDPFSRDRPLGTVGDLPKSLRIGVPRQGQLVFFGDRASEAGFAAALARLTRLGATTVEIDLEPFYETARLLYEGPWIAERYLVIRDLLASAPDAIHPVTREITLAGARPSAADAFAAFYRLEALRAVARRTFAGIDALLLPTAPTAYTTAQVLADPITLNSRLGTYTNFVNLLDLCGIAVPAAMRDDGIPFGVTLLAPAGRDAALAAIARVFHADTQLPVGATALPQPPLRPLAASTDGIALAVVGAHLSGMPLNHELSALDATLVETAVTAPDYKLYALAGTTPPKPGLLRVEANAGAAIALEIYSLSAAAFGRFVAAIPPPLGIGSIRLADGRLVKGFLVEPAALGGARDISAFGGWRAFMAAQG